MNTVLLDLDGTLLPMDMDVFIKAYFAALARRCAPMGYDGETLIAAVWRGTKAMVANDGSRSNEAVFWESFAADLGEEVLGLKGEFEDFYRREFDGMKAHALPNPLAVPSITTLREKGYRVVLATNPLFPLVGMETRLRWLGLAPGDFDLVTSYENCRFCKPNPGYYREILKALGKAPADCLMVGNDPEEDLSAGTLGIATFLVTDFAVKKKDAGLVPDHTGTFQDFVAYVDALPAVEYA